MKLMTLLILAFCVSVRVLAEDLTDQKFIGNVEVEGQVLLKNPQGQLEEIKNGQLDLTIESPSFFAHPILTLRNKVLKITNSSNQNFDFLLFIPSFYKSDYFELSAKSTGQPVTTTVRTTSEVINDTYSVELVSCSYVGNCFGCMMGSCKTTQQLCSGTQRVEFRVSHYKSFWELLLQAQNGKARIKAQLQDTAKVTGQVQKTQCQQLSTLD